MAPALRMWPSAAKGARTMSARCSGAQTVPRSYARESDSAMRIAPVRPSGPARGAPRREEHERRHAAVLSRGRAEYDLGDAGHARGDRRHEDRARVSGRAARHVDADALQRADELPGDLLRLRVQPARAALLLVELRDV